MLPTVPTWNMLLLLLSCHSPPACAEPVAGDVQALLIHSGTGYCCPHWRLLRESLRVDERLSSFIVLFAAPLCFFTPVKANIHMSKMVLHICRKEHCASPNVHVPQAVYTFSKWKACYCSPDFCAASLCLSTEHLQIICLAVEVTVSASLKPSERVSVGTGIPGHPSP